MTVKIREYRSGGFEVDIRTRLVSGKRIRERLKSPVAGRAASRRWGEEREAEILRTAGAAGGNGESRTLAPTLAEFTPRFFNDCLRANQYKPSGIYAKQKVLRRHLLPLLGTKRLDDITEMDVQAVKARLQDRKAGTVNCVLAVLSKMLNVAFEWGVLHSAPCRVKFLKVALPAFDFYDSGEYERLVSAAESLDVCTLVIVLLGGDAGLRRGEMLGLHWDDVDFERAILNVGRTVWRDIETLPKGGKTRAVPMTNALARALALLKDQQKKAGTSGAPAASDDVASVDRVFHRDDGRSVSYQFVVRLLAAAQGKAGLRGTGGPHILRHTFCSRLAMKAVPIRVIQEMAGHAKITTTLRYMHLSPSAMTDAIKLLDETDPPDPDEPSAMAASAE